MSLGHHICLRLANDRVIATSAQERRVVSRVLLALGREAGLLAFGLADNHLHLAPTSDRSESGRLAQAVEVSLQRRLALGAPFVPAFVKPIEDARHLYSTFRYVLGQRGHHGLDGDPLREATNLPDLLGLREIGAYTRANVRRFLPRIHRAELLELLDVPQLVPCDGPVERVLEATLAAAGLPGLAGSSRDVLAARKAIIEVVGRRVDSATLASWLNVSRRTLFRLKTGRACPELVTAVRLQLGLLTQVPQASLATDCAFLS